MDAATVQEDVVKEEDKKMDSDYHNREGGLRDEETSNDEIEDTDELVQSPKREFEKPSKDLQKKIRSQIEFHLSDENLKKHLYLLDLIRRYDEGYVDLKFLTLFQEMKAYTTDYKVVAYSLRDSDILVLNEESTYVRRRVQVPNDIQTARSCRVVAFHLPFELTVSSVAELFEPFGNIILIHLVRPGKTIPPFLGRELSAHIKQLNEVCVLIEFDKHQAAKEAVGKLKDQDVCQKGMRVTKVLEWRRDYRETANDQNSGKQVDIDNKMAGEDLPGLNEPNMKTLNAEGSLVEEHASTEAGGESPNSLSSTIEGETN